ncbi:MAG: hypothetical protein JJE30_08925 [Desulfuromonadales bacterium]|nr:hypothetical protein [Desulfuromonadales bacterium]
MFTSGQKIYFKRDTDKRLLKGTIIGQAGDGWQVRGARTASKITPPVFTLQAHEITTDHIPPRQRVKKLETSHGSGLSIVAAESIRRREITEARLGMTETQVLQARAMLEMRRRALRKLAATNGIAFSRYDYAFEELSSEYLVAAMSALRSTVSKAPDADLEEFRRYLSGEVADSRVMMTITRTSRTAAIRYLKRRTEYHLQHVDISDYGRRLAA